MAAIDVFPLYPPEGRKWPDYERTTTTNPYYRFMVTWMLNEDSSVEDTAPLSSGVGTYDYSQKMIETGLGRIVLRFYKTFLFGNGKGIDQQKTILMCNSVFHVFKPDSPRRFFLKPCI
jgi:hypothetical protein